MNIFLNIFKGGLEILYGLAGIISVVLMLCLAIFLLAVIGSCIFVAAETIIKKIEKKEKSFSYKLHGQSLYILNLIKKLGNAVKGQEQRKEIKALIIPAEKIVKHQIPVLLKQLKILEPGNDKEECKKQVTLLINKLWQFYLAISAMVLDQHKNVIAQACQTLEENQNDFAAKQTARREVAKIGL